MADYILVHGDTVNFNSAFAIATVTLPPPPVKIECTGKATLENKAVCIEGDEGSVSVAGCTYTTAIHSIPGTGTVTIDSLSGDQKATKTNSNGKPVLLKGSLFIAKFAVDSPAKQPPPAPGAAPIDDATPEYPGNGTFDTANAKWQGT